MNRVLLVAPDRVGPEMAGPGIRYVELARALAASCDVTIAAPPGSQALESGPEVVTYAADKPYALRRLVRPGDVVIAPPLAPHVVLGLGSARRPWIVDLYNPEPFEGLEHQKSRSRAERRARDILRIDRIAYAARTGTAFVCATERQRDMWLGFLAASRRLDSDRYEHDPELRTLIDVVPSGVPVAPPEPGERPVVRGPIFSPEALVLVWNGGLWDWLDPLTVLRALLRLRESDERWHLLFAGTSRPSHRGDIAMVERAMRLTNELGLERAVHFRPGWTPYGEMGALLLECDIGVCAHRRTLETRFAFRTRILDFVWAGLPILHTEGDEWSERVRMGELGEVVPLADQQSLAEAARRIAERGREAYAPALAREAARMTWNQVVGPLYTLIEAAADDGARPRRELARPALALRHGLASLAGRGRRR